VNVLDAIKARLDEAKALAADAAKRLGGALDLDAARTAAVDRLAAETVAANLADQLAAAEAAAEIERLADARGRRIAVIEQEQAQQAKNGAALQKGLADRFAAAVADLRAVIEDVRRAGHGVDLPLPPLDCIERRVADCMSAGSRMVAESKLSAEFIEDDRAVTALGEAQQGWRWSSGAAKPFAPHVAYQVIRGEVSPDSDQAAFVRSTWIADEDSRDRVLWQLGQGSRL
jgi:hypothetical protein